MNRYLLSAILIGTMAHGMDAPKSNTDDLNLLQDLIVKIHSEASGHERQNLASQIIALRRKLGIPDLYQDLPLGSYERTPVLDAISNQMASDAARLSAAADAHAVAELPAFDQIVTMNEFQLKAFQEKLIAQGGTISPFIQGKINERFEQLKFQEAWKAELSAPEAAAVERAVSSRKLQFANDSSSDSDMPALERVPQDQHAGEVAGESPDRVLPKQTTVTPKTSEVPAPSSTDDFEDALAPADDFKGSHDAQPAKVTVVGKDAQPVATSTHPLSETPQAASLDHQPVPAACPRSPAPEAPDTPSVAAASIAPADAPDDAKIAQELTDAFAKDRAQTPGGPQETPRSSVEPVCDAQGKAFGATPATLEDAKKAAGFPVDQAQDEGQTPGGPDDADAAAADQSHSETSTCADNTHLNAIQKGLIAAAVVGLVYGTAETVIAYRSISGHEWKQTSGIVNKAKLVMGKTWENVKKRPSQLMNLAKQVPAAGSSFVAALKSRVRAA